MDKDKMRQELQKKLNVVRYDILVKHYSELSHDFFYVAVEHGVGSNGIVAYKLIDLAKEFPDEILDFCKKHNLKLIKTSKGYRFEEKNS